MRIIAVIVSWNGREDTLACLESLSRSQPRPHVILVDNGSQDGTVTAVRSAFPQVEVIALPVNRHFAAGANVGLRCGLQQGADALWLLNNDVMVRSDALAAMLRVLGANPDVGIVGARLEHPQNPPGVIVGANCDFRTGAIIEPPPPAEPASEQLFVDYVWGCAMLMRAAALHHMGLFDESLVAYFEDADLCLRARRSGWRTATALRAVVYHAGSKTADRVFFQQMWLRGRNWWRVFWRHAPAETRPSLFWWLSGVRLPHLVWSALVTAVVRALGSSSFVRLYCKKGTDANQSKHSRTKRRRNMNEKLIVNHVFPCPNR